MPIYKLQINKASRGGQAALIAVILMLVIMLPAVFGASSVALKEAKVSSEGTKSRYAFYAAEAGVDDAVYRLKRAKNLTSSFNLTLNGATANTTVTTSGSTKTVKSTGDYSGASRAIKASLLINVSGVGFHYGVQVGAGGLGMNNNSTIVGNVYSNGPIVGSINGVKIGGDAVSAGAMGKIEDVQDIDGNATARYLEDVSVDGSTNSASLLRATVGGNAVSDSISNCTIGGNAIYDTKVSCTIGGTQTTPNPVNFQNPPNEPLPISDAELNAWEAVAEAGGVIGSQTYSGTNNSLGPKKINGNLILSNNAVLTVTGTLWVTGEIKLSNGSIIQLASSYGAMSGVVMAGTDGDSSAGYIEIDNNSQAKGSGTAGSYIMLLSQRNNTSSTAIKISNNAASAILYAGTGVIEIDNNAQLKEVTGYKLELKNGSDVIYESGLANAQFSSGPSGGWSIESWGAIVP